MVRSEENCVSLFTHCVFVDLTTGKPTDRNHMGLSVYLDLAVRTTLGRYKLISKYL